MKVLLFCAKGFETMEFSPFVDVFGWARNDYGHEVEVVTCGFQHEVVSAFGVTVRVNHTIDEICAKDYDALAIPGGFEEFGFYEEAYDERFLQLIREFHQFGKLIASVCVGALPIGKSGILEGRKATTYHLGGGNRQEQLRQMGAVIVKEPVCMEDNIITSYCPETAPFVALKLLSQLIGTENAEIVKKAMGF